MLSTNVALQQFASGNWQFIRDGVLLTADKIEPHVQVNSFDVSLGAFLEIPEPGGIVDLSDPDTAPVYSTMDLRDSDYVLLPGHVALGSVRERIVCNTPVDGVSYYQIYDGRSTTGRIFLISHCTAGQGDVGFSSAFTLEIVNLSPSPICLFYGLKIGQIKLAEVTGPARSYSGHYTHQDSAPGLPCFGPHNVIH
jgi:dCTP deaminase